MNLIIDFDNTIVNSDKAIWELYRKRTGDLSTDYRDHSVWWYDEICPKWSREEQDAAFQDPEFFSLLELMPGAIEVMKQLKAEGHTITICTVHKNIGVPMKVRWIRNHLDFIDNLVIIDDESKGYKSMIAGDIMLDDNISNLLTSSCKLAIAFGEGKWNQKWKGPRAKNWREFYRVVHEMVQDKRRIKEA